MFVVVFKNFIVIIPLIVNVVGFFVSLLTRPVSDRIGKKVHKHSSEFSFAAVFVAPDELNLPFFSGRVFVV